MEWIIYVIAGALGVITTIVLIVIGWMIGIHATLWLLERDYNDEYKSIMSKRRGKGA